MVEYITGSFKMERSVAAEPPGVSTKPADLGALDLSRGQKKNCEIATKVTYRNGQIGIPKGRPIDCSMGASAPVVAGSLIEGWFWQDTGWLNCRYDFMETIIAASLTRYR
jgi:hypothetical protein